MEKLEDPNIEEYSQKSPDISSMFSIREKIQRLVELSIQIVIENDATPDIENEFEPVLRAIERSYPPFHKQGVHFFSTLCSMQESAKTNQLLSSAGVKIPLQNFSNDWKRLCSVIDKLSNLNPPPHAKEISSKFKAVRSSLDTIKKTNEKRKHPTPSISNCITNINALGESVSKNIEDLFSQNYTDFGSNLYDSLRRDVKSFLTVINESFSNEFVQSGVMLCDLYRIRSNIFTDCNEIVESLKSAFVFPKEMREIKELKDATELELARIFAKLSVQFVVIKPSIQNVVIPASEKSKNKQESNFLKEDKLFENIFQKVENNNIENEEAEQKSAPKQDYLAALNRIDEFSEKVFELLGEKIDYARDSWSNLDEISRLVGLRVEEEKQREKKVEALKLEIRALKEKSKDDELLFDKKNEFLVSANELNRSKIKTICEQNKALQKQCAELQAEIDKVRLKYSNLKAKGDALLYRKALVDIAKMVKSEVKIDFLNQTNLIEKVKEIVKEEIERPCSMCPILEGQIKNTKSEIVKILQKVEKLKEEEEKVKVTVPVETEHEEQKLRQRERSRTYTQSTTELPSKFAFTTQPPVSPSDARKANKLSKSANNSMRNASFVARVGHLSPIKSDGASDSCSCSAMSSAKSFNMSLEDLARSGTVTDSERSFNISLEDLARSGGATDSSRSIDSITAAAAATTSRPRSKTTMSAVYANASIAKSTDDIASSPFSTSPKPSGIAKSTADMTSGSPFSTSPKSASIAKSADDMACGSPFSASASPAPIDEEADTYSAEMPVMPFGSPSPSSRVQGASADLDSLDTPSLLASLDTAFAERHAALVELYGELAIGKQPVVDAILMVDGRSRARADLMSELPSRLRRVLHGHVESIIKNSEAAKQAFKKREYQYIKTLFQIGEKLSKLASKDSPVLSLDDGKEMSEERDRIIDHISSQLKIIRQNIANFENDAISQKKLAIDLRRQKDSLRQSFCAIFNASPAESDKATVEKCRQILQKEKNGYLENIRLLSEKVDNLQSEAICIEELVSGAAQEREGTIHEKLGRMHDKTEAMRRTQDRMEKEVAALKEALMNVASVLENRNDMGCDESAVYVGEFCRMHSGGVRVIDREKFERLFEKCEYDKEASLGEILESLLERMNAKHGKR